MECCYQPNCEEYAVTPMLVAPPCTTKYCHEEPACVPCLPRCQKPVYYCCTKEPPPPKREYYCCAAKEVPKRDCCPLPPQTVCCPPQTVCCRPRSTPPRHDCSHGGAPPPPQQQVCSSCCARPPPPKPVKTKYIMPCYRYEDGRIVSFLTLLFI